MSELIETAELEAFVHIVDAGSLTAAADQIGVPRATLTRRLARLEERLDTRLLHRTTRQQVLTDAGAGFYRHAVSIISAVSAAQASVEEETGRIAGDLRVSMPPGDETLLYPLLLQYNERYPDVRLQVTFSAAHVDLLREGFDVAIRAGDNQAEGLVQRTLAHAQRIGVASRAYLDQHGTPRTLQELTEHRLLVGFDRGAVPSRQWTTTEGVLRFEPYLASNDIRYVGAAMRAGQGIALLPRGFVEDALASGEAVEVLPELLRSDSRVAVVYPDRDYLPPQVRAFVELVVDWSKAMEFDGTRARE